MDFRLTRRALLFAALPGTAFAQIARLAPDGPALRWEGKAGQVTLPRWSPRTMAMLLADDESVSAVAITDQSPDSQLEVLLVAHHDGTLPRILALEPLQWQSPYGKMTTRLVIDPDRNMLIFDRNCAVRRSGQPIRREMWRDFLAWSGTKLVDKPVRPAPPGTQQALLTAIRAKALAWLASPRQSVTAQDLASFGMDAASFDLRER